MNCKKRHCELKKSFQQKFNALFELCEKNYQRILKEPKKHFDTAELFVNLGVLSLNLLRILKQFICFVGEYYTLFQCFKKPKAFRFVAFLYHIENSALKALPIVILTALLVGVVLAYQASVFNWHDLVQIFS